MLYYFNLNVIVQKNKHVSMTLLRMIEARLTPRLIVFHRLKVLRLTYESFARRNEMPI